MATTGAVAATPAAKMTERQQLAIALRESMSAAATPVTAGGTSARAEASPDGEARRAPARPFAPAPRLDAFHFLRRKPARLPPPRVDAFLL